MGPREIGESDSKNTGTKSPDRYSNQFEDDLREFRSQWNNDRERGTNANTKLGAPYGEAQERKTIDSKDSPESVWGHTAGLIWGRSEEVARQNAKLDAELKRNYSAVTPPRDQVPPASPDTPGDLSNMAEKLRRRNQSAADAKLKDRSPEDLPIPTIELYDNNTKAERSVGGSTDVARNHETVTALDGSAVTATKGSTVFAEKGSRVIAMDGSKVIAHEGSTVHADGGSEVIAKKGSVAYAENGGQVTAEGGSYVKALKEGLVIARGGTVDAYPGSQVIAHDHSKVNAYEGSNVTARSGSTVEAHHGSIVTVKPDAQVTAHSDSVVRVEDGAAVAKEPGAKVYHRTGPQEWKLLKD